jgi:hypothetical protein
MFFITKKKHKRIVESFEEREIDIHRYQTGIVHKMTWQLIQAKNPHLKIPSLERDFMDEWREREARKNIAD